MYWTVTIILAVIGFIYFLCTMDDLLDGEMCDMIWYKKLVYYWAIGPISWSVLFMVKLHKWLTKED